jgi:hypothetical protein
LVNLRTVNESGGSPKEPDGSNQCQFFGGCTLAQIRLEFGRLILTADDLRQLPEHERSFFIALEIALSDIMFFQYIFVQVMGARNDAEDDEIARKFSVVRSLITARVVFSKIFECVKLVEGYNTVLVRKGTPNQLITDAIGDLDDLFHKETRFKALIEWQRNKVTNHYIFQEYHRFFDRYDSTHEFELFFNKMEGNCFSTLGEEAATFGQMNLLGGYTLDDIAALQEWAGTISNRFIKLRSAHLKDMLRNRFPSKALIKGESAVSDHLVADLKRVAMPIYMKLDKP